MIFKAPTGVVMRSALQQVQGLHIFAQKQPLRNRFVSTNTDFFDDFFCCVVSRFVIVVVFTYVLLVEIERVHHLKIPPLIFTPCRSTAGIRVFPVLVLPSRQFVIAI